MNRPAHILNAALAVSAVGIALYPLDVFNIATVQTDVLWWWGGALVGTALAPWPDIDLRFKRLGHRTITHAIWWPLLIALIPHPFARAIALALLTHPLLDVVSGGCAIFWPLPRVGFPLVKTGGFTESLWNAAALALFGWWVWPTVAGWVLPVWALFQPGFLWLWRLVP